MHSTQKSLCKDCECACMCPWPKHRLPNENLFVLSLIQILCGVAAVILSGVSISKKTLRHEVASGIWTGVAMMISGCHGVLTSRRKKPCLMISLLVLSVVVLICSLVMTGLSAAGVVQDSINEEDSLRSQKILIHCLLLIVGLLESIVAFTSAVIVAREVCFLSTIHYNGHTYLVAPASRSNRRAFSSYLLGSEISHLYLSRERDSDQIASLAAPLNSPDSFNESISQARTSSQGWSCTSHVRTATSNRHSSRHSTNNDASQDGLQPASQLLFMPYASPGDWPVGPPTQPPPYSQSVQTNYSAVIDQHFQPIEASDRSSSPTIYEPSPNVSPIFPRSNATECSTASTTNATRSSEQCEERRATTYYTIPRNPEVLRHSLTASSTVAAAAAPQSTTNGLSEDLPPTYESLGYLSG